MKVITHAIAAVALSMISIATFGSSLYSDFDFENNINAKKVLSKELPVNKQTILNVTHSHGNIKIVPWNQAKASFDVYVEDIMNTEDLNKIIQVTIAEEGNTINAETKHLKKKVRYRTNIVIHVPASTETVLRNKFGDIIIEGDMKNFCDIEQKFGNIYAKSFLYNNSNRANVITVSYGDAMLETSTWLNAKISFGSLKMDKCHAIGLNCHYSDANINTAKFVNVSIHFSNLIANTLENIKGKTQHSDLRIGELKGNMSLVAEFGDIKVNKISKSFSNIDIQSNFTEGKLNFEPNCEFMLEGKGSYTGFKLFNIGEDSQNVGDSFKRTVGKNPQKTVKITAKFGNWQFMRD